MTIPDSNTLRLIACAAAFALPLMLGSCSSSSSRGRGAPANLPTIDLHGTPATPAHSMSRSDYPFDPGGTYVSSWAAEGEARAGRSAASSSDYDGWRASHHGSGSSARKSSTSKTKSSASSKSKSGSKTAGTAKKKTSGGRNHSVKRGDTLSSIARKYGTSVSKLKTANGLKSDVIRDGRALKIP